MRRIFVGLNGGRLNFDCLLFVAAVALLAALLPLGLASRGLRLKVETIDGLCVDAHLPLHYARLQACANAPIADRLAAGAYYRFRFEPGTIGTTERNYVLIERPEETPLKLRLRSIVFLE